MTSNPERNEDDSLTTASFPKTHVLRRAFLYALTAFFMVFYVGAFFGFGPIQLMLEQDGAFSHICENSNLPNDVTQHPTNATAKTNPNEHTVCNRQSQRLVNVHFVASIVTQILTPAFGEISDRYGPFVLIIFLSTLGCCGFVTLIISSVTRVPELLYLAFLLIGSMTMASAPIIMDTAYLYSLESSRRRVISSLNTLWDIGGGFGYWVLWAIGDSINATLRQVISVYLGVAVCVYGASSYLWKVIIRARNQEGSKASTNMENQQDDLDRDSISSLEKQQESIPCTTHEDLLSDDSTHHDEFNRTNHTSENIKRKTFVQELSSTRFIILTGLFSLHVSRIAFTLTTSRDFLRSLGDDNTGNKYLTILSITTPVGIIGIPLVELIVGKWGYIFGLQVINIVAIVHGIILLGSKDLNVQIVGFLVFAVYRCFAFAIILSYLAFVSEKHVLGKLTGVICAVPGVLQLANLPLSTWALTQLNGNFFWPNFIYTMAVVPCIFTTFYLYRTPDNSINPEVQS